MSISFVNRGRTNSYATYRMDGGSILRHLSIVDIARGEVTAKFSMAARILFATSEVGISSLNFTRLKGVDYINFKSRQGELSLPEAAAQTFLKRIADKNGFLDEQGLIAHADAERVPKPNEFSDILSRATATLFPGSLLGQIRDKSGHKDANIQFIRMIKDPLDQSGKSYLVGITMNGGCSDCVASSLSTLKFVAQSIQKHVFKRYADRVGGAQVGGIVVLPTMSGSPSYTYRAPREVIDAEPVYQQGFSRQLLTPGRG